MRQNLNLQVANACAVDVNHAKSLEEKFFFGVIKAHGPVVTSCFAQEVKFEKFFPTITDEVFETVFGKVGKETLLRMLYEHYSLTPHRIGEDPRFFIEGLEELVGSGAQVIIKSVVGQMHSKMGIT